jgi:hypothetical protein
LVIFQSFLLLCHHHLSIPTCQDVIVVVPSLPLPRSTHSQVPPYLISPTQPLTLWSKSSLFISWTATSTWNPCVYTALPLKPFCTLWSLKSMKPMSALKSLLSGFYDPEYEDEVLRVESGAWPGCRLPGSCLYSGCISHHVFPPCSVSSATAQPVFASLPMP